MKKTIIVLLIAVLVAGFAFAGTLTGSAGLSFITDLEKKTWEFSNDRLWNYSFTFTYDTTKVAVKGETKAWAELSIDASATAKVDAKNKSTNPGSGDVTNQFSVTLKTANINFQIGEKLLTFGLLNSGASVNYVSSFYKVGSAALNYVKGPDEKLLPGFNVSFDGYKGGLGAKGYWTEKDFIYNVFLHGQTKKYELAEKQVTVQAAAWTVLSNDSKVLGSNWNDRYTFGGGVSTHYGRAASGKGEEKVEADKLQANLKADASYETKDKTFKYEVAADAAYTIANGETVKLEVYFAPGKADTTTYKNADADKFIVSAKLNYDAHTFTFGEGNTLKLSGYAQILDILIDKRELTVSATEVLTLKVDKSLKFTFTETYNVLVAKTLALSAKVDYTAKDDKFVATATIAPSFQFADSEKYAITAFKVSGEIYTEQIISLAKIGLKYESADFAKKAKTATTPEKIANKGKVTAYVSIKFPNAVPKKDDAEAPAAK